MKIITLEGLRKLAEMEREERPENWEELVLNYLNYKLTMLKAWKERYELVKAELDEAIKIAHKLGVIWVSE
jgi:hypothetical protein